MPLSCVDGDLEAQILVSVSKSLCHIVTLPNSKDNIIKHNAAYQNAFLQSCTSSSNSSTQVRLFATVQWHYIDKSRILLMFSDCFILQDFCPHTSKSPLICQKNFIVSQGRWGSHFKLDEKLALKTPLGILNLDHSKSLLPIKKLLFNLKNCMWLKGQASKGVNILMLSAENLLS